MKRCVALLLLAILTLPACEREQGEEASSEPEPGAEIEVDLPPVPDINIERPTQYPDGSISIWALGANRAQYLEQPVRVTAYTIEIYTCPFRQQMEARDRLIRYRNYLTEDEMASLEQVGFGEGADVGSGEGTGQEGRCNYPHMFIADSMNSEHTLLVTGYGPALEARLVVGERYLFEGRLLEETRGFNAAGRGLIYVSHMSGGSLDLPTEGAEGAEEAVEIR